MGTASLVTNGRIKGNPTRPKDTKFTILIAISLNRWNMKEDKKKKFTEKYSKKVSKRPINNKKNVDVKWIIIVTLTAFILSLVFSFLGETIAQNANIIISIIIVVFFILIGIIFDMIGIAVTVSDIKAFNSMASKRVSGAKLAVRFIKNSEKVSSFCNDVIGDICGILSGSTGIAIGLMISSEFGIETLVINLFITALIAASTIGGKAIGKSFAINKSNSILYVFAKTVAIFYPKKGK